MMYVITARKVLHEKSIPVCLTRKVPVSEFDRGMFCARMLELVKHIPSLALVNTDAMSLDVNWPQFGVGDFMSITSGETSFAFAAVYVPVLI